jgi:alanine-glyoxylate transaminase/serine-glyoxylate transaminase/serine-pyruvate transaminase
MSLPTPVDPPTRLLAGPGPSNVHPDVVASMQQPQLGHLDPAFLALLDEIVAMQREVYRRMDGAVLTLSASGTSGMEAGLSALLEPGDTAVVAVSGFFGRRIAEIAWRVGARVVELERPFGEVVPTDEILAALDAHEDVRLVAAVHAETSTGARYPVEEIAGALRDRDVLFMADCVTSLGGIPLDAQGWGIDWCYSCTQKCLGAPPGLSPLAISDRALELIRARKAPVPFALDVEALLRYWVARPATYHHTLPILQFYALHSALRLVLDEGLEARWARHADAGSYFQAALRERGIDLLADPAHQLPQLSAVRVPEGVDGPAVQRRLLNEFGIEVGGGLGPDAPPIWRVGLMGVNANRETADRLLEAFDHVLAGSIASR